MPSIDGFPSGSNAEPLGAQTTQGAGGARQDNEPGASQQSNGVGPSASTAICAPNVEVQTQTCQITPNGVPADTATEATATNARGPVFAAIAAPLTPEEEQQISVPCAMNSDLAIELMLTFMIRRPEVTEVALRAFDERAFTQVGNSRYRIIWTAVRQHWLETGQLPALDVLLAKIGLVVENDPLILPNMRRQAIEHIGELAVRFHRCPPESLSVEEGRQRIKTHLLGMNVYRPLAELRDCVMGAVREEAWQRIMVERDRIERAIADSVDTDVSLEALTSGTYTHNWLVKNVLVEGSPAIVGGPKKALKTSILLDLAVSLGVGAGGMFLNHYRFRVEKQVAVGMYSGESNAPTVATTVRNILASKNRKPAEAAVCLQFATPKLSDDGDLAAIQAFIKKRNLKVIIFDPAYTSLLKGNTKASASNVFDMGAVLSKISEACLAAGATPIFAHHTVKNAGMKSGRNGASFKSYEPAELGDLAFAGFGEFARQWLLIARRADYEPGTGKHQLWVTTGGSAGFNGTYAVDIDEGVMGEDFRGKKWEVTVQTQAEAARSQVSAKVDAAARKELEDRQGVLDALGQYGGREGITLSKLMEHIAMRRPTVQRHLAALSNSGSAEICGEYRGGSKWRASCWSQGTTLSEVVPLCPGQCRT